MERTHGRPRDCPRRIAAREVLSAADHSAVVTVLSFSPCFAALRVRMAYVICGRFCVQKVVGGSLRVITRTDLRAATEGEPPPIAIDSDARGCTQHASHACQDAAQVAHVPR